MHGLGLYLGRVRDLILHADDCGRGAYAQKAALGALDYLDGDVVALEAQLGESRGEGLILGLCGFLKIFLHFTFSCCSPSAVSGASSAVSGTPMISVSSM